jgi:hypothetical protein
MTTDPATDKTQPPVRPSAAAAATPLTPGATGSLRHVQLGRRQWTIILIAAAVLGVVTLPLMMSNGSAAPPEAAAAPVAASATPAMTSAGTAPADAAAPTWSSENRALWLSHPKGLAFEMPALNRITVWTKSVKPSLVVRCAAGSAEVFVFTETAAKIEPGTNDHTVTYSIDGEPGVTGLWTDSANHDGLFAPDGSAFAQRLMHARTLMFQFSPHNASPAVVHFTVGGLPDVLDPTAKECGWKKEGLPPR